LEKDNPEISYLAELLASLDERNMSGIDFDRLKKWLATAVSKEEAYENLMSQLTAMKEDYQQRIAGMVKAMAAVDRNRDNQQQALELVDGLKDMTGEELVTCYRKTSARFRDMFPASFGLPTSCHRTKTGLKSWNGYK